MLPDQGALHPAQVENIPAEGGQKLLLFTQSGRVTHKGGHFVTGSQRLVNQQASGSARGAKDHNFQAALLPDQHFSLLRWIAHFTHPQP